MSRGAFCHQKCPFCSSPRFTALNSSKKCCFIFPLLRLCVLWIFFFLDKLENPKVKKNPSKTNPSLGRAEIATEELGAAVPGVLGGDLHIRMGVVGFCPWTELFLLNNFYKKKTKRFSTNLCISSSQAVSHRLHLVILWFLDASGASGSRVQAARGWMNSLPSQFHGAKAKVWEQQGHSRRKLQQRNQRRPPPLQATTVSVAKNAFIEM